MFYLKNLIEQNEEKSEEIKSNIYFVIINNWKKKFPKFFFLYSSRAICFIIIYWQFIMPLAFIFSYFSLQLTRNDIPPIPYF